MPQVTIQDVRIETVTKGRNSYQVATVVHTTPRGETKEKKVMSFSNPAVYATVSKATSGQVYDVGYTPGDQYYNWATISLMEAPGATPKASTGGTAAPAGDKVSASTYETAEERKIKQMYIIKQSSIGHAIDLMKHNNPGMQVDEDVTLELAQKFVDFVYGTNETLAQGLDEMDNDI
jgi:hypothetical protein